MELRVKQKIVNGKKVMGIINENLREIAPFEFKNIVEIGENGYRYFICEKEDATCSLYDNNGCCRINCNDGYKDLKVLKYSLSDNRISVVAKKDGEIGILSVGFERENGYIKPSIEVAYKFGKCDEIKEFDNGIVQLIKHTKGEDHIGYWYHPNIDEIVEPKYLSYDYYTIKCKNGVGLYKNTDATGAKKTDSYQLSNHIEYDKLTLNVEMIKYLKLKNKKKVIGLRQKVYDPSKSNYHPSFKFEEFLPAIYSNISYDEEKQIFFLEQTINGQVKKGFIGVTFDWHFRCKGWWIWGYPNLRIEVNVPCEFDDIELIENNCALVNKDGKYGLIKFSFGKSNGDWDRFNRKYVSYGRCHEIVPCIYDSIVQVQDNFIGKINEEEKIITDYIDYDAGETIIVANNYKKVKQIFEHIFLCDLDDGKKEVVLIKKYYNIYSLQNNKSCIISKISPCDYAEIISNNSGGYLIKVTHDNINDIYFENEEKLEKLEENIVDITCDTENRFYIITKNNGHMKCVESSGNVMFTTDNLGIEPNNLSVTYLKAIGKFRVTNNNLTKIYSSLNKNDNNEIYKNRLFSCFDVLQTKYYTFVGYTEVLEDGLITKLSHVNTRDKMKETEILSGNFQVENIILEGKRIIFSTIDSESNQKKYGVIESQEGNICIDCNYSNIQFDSNNQVFICSTDDGELLFDIDGFINESQNIVNRSTNQHVLKLTLQK